MYSGLLKLNVCASGLDLNMERLPVEVTVVRSQPGPVSDGRWSTGLCECWEDMGDCEYSLSSGMPYINSIKIRKPLQDQLHW